MKKQDLFILCTTILYSILFYEEVAGINFLIFSLALCMTLFLGFPEKSRHLKWMLSAAGALISGFAVFYLGNTLSVTGNVLSLALLSAFTFEPKTSVISAWCYAFFTIMTAAGFMLMSVFERPKQVESAEKSPKRIKLFSIILPLFIVFVFFMLYRAGNALFFDFTKKINLDFITPYWIYFTGGGFFIMYSFYRYRAIPEILEPESLIPNALPKEKQTAPWLRRLLPLSQEYVSGLVALISLNILTLLLNALDCKYLFVDGHLPAGVTHAGFVHEGVGVLIVSMIIAITILLFYFRGELNFAKGKNLIAVFAYLWLIQNMFMLYTSACKNAMYIHQFSLTYKRIGVYAWLLLAFFGLLTTAWKIYRIRTNFFLFRINAWLCYGALVGAGLFNWDKTIAEYNIQYSRNVDYGYLLSLSYNTLGPVIKACKEKGLLQKPDKPYTTGDDPYERNYYPPFSTLLRQNISAFLFEQKHYGWQSACLRKIEAGKEIQELIYGKAAFGS